MVAVPGRARRRPVNSPLPPPVPLAESDPRLPILPDPKGRKAKAFLLERPWLLVGIVYALVYEGVRRASSGAWESWVTNVGVLPISVLAGWRAFATARASAVLGSGASRPWRLLGAGLLTLALGDALWCVAEDLRGVSPSDDVVTNLVYYVHYGLTIAALMAFPGDARRGPRTPLLLDIGTVFVAVSMAFWRFVLRPQLAAASGAGASVLPLLHSFGDVALFLAVTALVLRMPGSLGRRTVALLAAGFLCGFAADVIWAVEELGDGFETGGIADTLWVADWVLVLAACERHTHVGALDRAPSVPSGGRPLGPLPYVAAALAFALLVAEVLHAGALSAADLVAGVVGLTGLLVARQLLALRENAKLWRERADLLGEARLSALVRHAADGVLLLDAEGTVRWASPSVHGIGGATPEALVGTPFRKLADGPDQAALAAALSRSRSSPRTPVRTEWTASSRPGVRGTRVESAMTNLLDDPAVRGFVVNVRDVTERAALEEQLTHQAFHDPLTGLANRSLFRDRVEQALARAHRSGRLVAVVFVDLDDFKTVNDGLGHGAGDALLGQVAQRIRAVVRDCDTAARLGGDEFAVLAEDLADDAAAVRLAERVLEAFREPFVVEGLEVPATASVGVATSRDGGSRESLLRNADTAMYAAKARRRGSVVPFEPTMQATALENLEIQTQLRAAIERGELRVVYQPIVRTADRTVSGMEALVRWRHPTLGEISPVRFIPLAEGSGLILSLGRFVLERALADVASLRGRWPGPSAPSLSVNVSARQLHDPEFVGMVRAALERTGFPPERLCLEVTESLFVQRAEGILGTLHAVKQLGVRLGIDDFGTGYSSLSYLHRFPLDVLKIPREFVERLDSGEDRDSMLAQSIVALGAALGLRTIAEGVETETQAAALRTLGCEHAQGYLFSRPTTLDAVLDLAVRSESGAYATVAAGGR